MKNNSRDFIIFMWGAILASMWWAMFKFDGLPVGPINFYLLYTFTPIATVFSIGYFIVDLFKAAFSNEEE